MYELQSSSGLVKRLPSDAAARIAVTGRQNRKSYFASNPAMNPSAIAKFVNARMRADFQRLDVLLAKNGVGYPVPADRRVLVPEPGDLRLLLGADRTVQLTDRLHEIKIERVRRASNRQRPRQAMPAKVDAKRRDLAPSGRES